MQSVAALRTRQSRCADNTHLGAQWPWTVSLSLSLKALKSISRPETEAPLPGSHGSKRSLQFR